MTINQLIQYLEDPCVIQPKDIADIKNLCTQYPYFYHAQALYLKYLKDSEDLQFNSALKITSLQAPDRTMLYNLMQKQAICKPAWSKPKESSADTETDTEVRKADNADSSAATINAGQSGPHKEPRKEMPNIRAMETEYKLDENDISTEHKLKHQDLIDKFIAADPHIHPVGQFPITGSDEQGQAGTLDISYTDEDVTDSVFSESLARIYIKQKQYAKAIRIFEKLNLKYPEKSTYFADQIRFLNKVIKNS